jgi:AcrR family transcriptional regulator
VSVEGKRSALPSAGDGAELIRPARKPRADALRNRVRLMETAKAAFADVGVDASFDEIARRAGVGIGTLYRHFPTRDAIVEAVYRHEVEQLAGSATRLIETSSPADALHAWMQLFVDYIATKKVIAAALGSIVGGAPDLYASTALKITGAISLLVDRAKAAGDIRTDVDPNDLLRALVGFTYGAASPDWQASALRLIDILMDGLRPPRG